MKNLNWATPIGRNTDGKFVSLKNIRTAEIEAAVETLKTETVKAKGPIVFFTSGKYGSLEKNIEVTDKLVLGRKISNKMFGEDPLPKVKKMLFVKANVNGKEVEIIFKEGEKLVF